MSFFRNAAGLLATSTICIPVAFLTSVVLARYLSVADRGLYSVAMTAAGAGAMVGQLGWPAATIYRLRRLGSRPAYVLGAGMAVALGSSLIIIAVGLFFAPVIKEGLFPAAPESVYPISLALIPWLILGMLFGGITKGIDCFRYHNYYRLFNVFGTLGVAIFVLIYIELGIVGALVGTLLIQIGTTLGFFIAIVRRTGVSLRFPRDEVVGGLKFGLRSWIYGLGGQIHERIDIFMISALTGDPEQVAYYAVAVGIVEQLKILPSALGDAAFARMASESFEHAAAFACGVSRQLVGGLMIGVPVLAIVAALLIAPIYGQPYRLSVEPTLILLPAMALHSIFRILAYYFAAIDRQKVNIQIQFSAILLNVVLNSLLIPVSGIQGAAIASFCSYSLEAVLIMFVFGRFTGHGPRSVLLFGRDDLMQLAERGKAVIARVSGQS